MSDGDGHNSSWFKKGAAPSGGHRTYGRQSKTSPKTCTNCSRQGAVRDSVRYPQHIRRRYRCVCGWRWTTYEVTVDEKDLENLDE